MIKVCHLNRGLLSSFAVWMLTFVFFSGCDESLPPRAEPVDVLVASIDNLPGTVTFQINATGPDGIYGAFFLQLKNTYVEVLQESALVKGDIEVWLRDHPAYRAVVHADGRDLMNSWIIRAKIATLGPDSSANFLRQWNHHATDGAPFWAFARFTEGRLPPFGEKYYLSDSVFIVAKARLQIFQPVYPEETPERTFALRYRIFVVDTPSTTPQTMDSDE